MTGNLWGAVKTAYDSGVLLGGYPFAKNFRYVGGNALQAGIKYNTLAAMFNSCIDGDVCYVGPEFYDEGGLVISANNVTVIGGGNRGCTGIAPTTVGLEGLQILGNDVTLINFGVASEATADYSLKIGSQTVSPARFRAYQCKFEGNEGANPGSQVLIQGAADVILDDCEICWGVNGIVGDANDNGFPTEILIRDCWFHDLTTVHIGIASGDHFVNLWLRNNFFDKDETGTPPTDFILLSDNANIGVITNNHFASATNATGTITIGSGLIYMANATEAGWSTARPA